MMHLNFIVPQWPAPANVKALQTTRVGGVSQGVYAGFNLGTPVQDDPMAVSQNRQLLNTYVPSEPVWLNQVHGVEVIDAAKSGCVETADASFTTHSNVVCVTMTADCLPVLLCDTQGTVVAAVHAGWRGLCDGVIEATVSTMPVSVNSLMAWLGPAIGPNAFEVGDEVRQQFIQRDKQAALAFRKHGEKWLCDMYMIAQQRLRKLGVEKIYGGGVNERFCTYSEAERFFSFRRDNVTGRMASLIWLSNE